jgi:hypothetical protein
VNLFILITCLTGAAPAEAEPKREDLQIAVERALPAYQGVPPTRFDVQDRGQPRPSCRSDEPESRPRFGSTDAGAVRRKGLRFTGRAVSAEFQATDDQLLRFQVTLWQLESPQDALAVMRDWSHHPECNASKAGQGFFQWKDWWVQITGTCHGHEKLAEQIRGVSGALDKLMPGQTVTELVYVPCGRERLEVVPFTSLR